MLGKQRQQFFLFFCTFWLCLCAYANTSIILDNNTQDLTLSKNIEYFADPSLEYTLADIQHEQQRGVNIGSNLPLIIKLIIPTGFYILNIH